MKNVTNATRRPTNPKAAALAIALMAGLAFLMPAIALADPPDWAPAWGWRAKQGNHDDGDNYKHYKKHKHEHDEDYDDDDDDGEGRVVYRRDVVRCDSRRYDGTIGDLAGVLIDRTLGVPVDRGERCYTSRRYDQRGLIPFDPYFN